MAMQGVSPLIRRLADASFTMYIVHYPIMLAIKLATRPIGLGPWGGFAVALLVGGLLSWLIHDRLVSRSRWLALLLNGRLPAWETIRPVKTVRHPRYDHPSNRGIGVNEASAIAPAGSRSN
jgi:peptidoglycan/LPS O-acetylase OafA/YrhL